MQDVISRHTEFPTGYHLGCPCTLIAFPNIHTHCRLRTKSKNRPPMTPPRDWQHPRWERRFAKSYPPAPNFNLTEHLRQLKTLQTRDLDIRVLRSETLRRLMYLMSRSV